MTAISISRTETDQTQSIAYGHDLGRTWTEYEGNAVIGIEDPAFRDLKVLWYEPAACP